MMCSQWECILHWAFSWYPFRRQTCTYIVDQAISGRKILCLFVCCNDWRYSSCFILIGYQCDGKQNSCNATASHVYERKVEVSRITILFWNSLHAFFLASFIMFVCNKYIINIWMATPKKSSHKHASKMKTNWNEMICACASKWNCDRITRHTLHWL